MQIIRYEMPIVTSGSGTGIAFALDANEDHAVISGYLRAVSYIKDDTDPFADTVDFTVALNSDAEEPAWRENNVTQSKIVYPHRIAHDIDGSPATNMAGGNLWVPVVLYQSKLGIFVTNGGNTKSGMFHAYVELAVLPFNFARA